jgi:predicted DCC family thiol-disulfide oxidoreductase YuxK
MLQRRMTPPLHRKTPIVLFDGVCNLCNGAVQWIVKRDQKAVFCFASLQSEAAQEALRAVGHTTPLPDSLVLIADGTVSVRTAAVLGIARRLPFPWSLAVVFFVIPPFLRDPIYSWIARNRYRWFGKRETCMVPTKELRAKFLDRAK